MKNKVFAILLAITMFLGLIPPASAHIYATDSFTFEFAIDSSVSQRVDLTNIKIDVYGLSVTYEDASSHNKDFEDDHIQTLNVGQNGKISFERPSEYFRITVDLSSLPSGIGISNYTCDYDSTKTHDLFTLFSVKTQKL